jgi:hypothetical protein
VEVWAITLARQREIAKNLTPESILSGVLATLSKTIKINVYLN